MPRTARISLPGACYHAWTRAGEGLLLFRDDSDHLAFEKLAAGLLARFPGIRVAGWCALPDELHLTASDEGSDFTSFMRLLLGRYSRHRKDLRGTGRRLYGGERYRSRAFEDRSALTRIADWIHSLPVERGLVLFADSWRWSGLRGTIPVQPRPGLPAEAAEPDWGSICRSTAPPPPGGDRMVPDDPAGIIAREMGIHRSRLVNPRGREDRALRHRAFRECRDRWGMTWAGIARSFGVTPAAVISAVAGRRPAGRPRRSRGETPRGARREGS